MAEVFNNLASSTLASGITAGAVTLTIASGDGNDLFPSLSGADFFRCVLFNKSTGEVEIIRVTARSADTFTIVRAIEGIGNITATAYAFSAGDLIELRPTSAFFTALAVGVTSSNIQIGKFLYGVDTGAADAYVVAMTPTAASISDGQEIRVKIAGSGTNTGIAATLKLDALPNVPITMEGGGNPPAGSIKAGFVHTFHYDGTSAILQNAGLALTSSGFHALSKQIKNVAAGTAETDVSTIGGIETLTSKTLTSPTLNTPTLNTPTLNTPTLNSPVLNTAISGTGVKDEDDMSSDSDTHLATQQSIKAYIDAVLANLSDQFTRSLEVDGYQQLPGGMIMQWGTDPANVVHGSYYNITFPIAFTTECLNISLTQYGTDTLAEDAVLQIDDTSITVTGFDALVDGVTTASRSPGCSWFAIGY